MKCDVAFLSYIGCEKSWSVDLVQTPQILLMIAIPIMYNEVRLNVHIFLVWTRVYLWKQVD